MTTVRDILTCLEKMAPVSMKMEWDNVGLLCGRAGQEVTKILVALDPFLDVAQEAAQIGAQLIVTHHPLIFQPVQAVNDCSWVGQTILFLIEHEIAAINAHTNLDCAPGGVNDCLAAALGLSKVQVLSPSGVDGQGRPWGLLRGGFVAPQSLQAFLGVVKESLGCQGLRYVDAGKPVRQVAVGGGACASELGLVAQQGYDTFVTADVKYNQFWDAQALGLNLIDAGHFYTEQPVCQSLRQTLQAAFPAVNVVVSQTHRDCMKFL